MRNLTEQHATLGALLRRPYQVLSDRLYARLTEEFPEIRPAHSAVLRHLPPDGARLTDLADMAQITKQSMAYLTETLQKGGYLQVTPDPSDGRAKLVRFTDRGEQCLARALALSAEFEAVAAARIGSGKMQTLRSLLLDLGAALQDGQELPGRPGS